MVFSQFIATIVLVLMTTIGSSMLWPRFTRQPRPAILEQVHDAVIKTPAGQSTAQILGVSDERNIEPFTVSGVANSIVTSVTTAVRERAAVVISYQIVNQLINQYQKISPEQQQYVQDKICQNQVPVSTASASSTQ